MFNLFKRETEEAMIKLIASQGDLIALYKEAKRDQDEIISHLKRLLEINEELHNLQEGQIDDLKKELHIYRSRLESYSESIEHYKNKISELEDNR